MKWSSVLLVTLLALVAAVGVINCGQSNHGPGSDGMADTGSRMLLSAFLPFDGGKQTMDISMIPGSTTDPIFDAAFSVKVESAPPTPGGKATTGITVESYQVEYISTDAGSVPIPTMSNVGVFAYIAPGEAVTLSGLVLMPVGAKIQWLADGGDGNLTPIYQCKVTFFGVNDFGYEMSATGNVGIILGNYSRK